MRKSFLMACVISLVGALALPGCSSMGENTKRGAVGGALVGSIAGGVIGYQSGNPFAGAAIGAGVGALGGGLIGKSIDDKQARTKDEIMASGEKLGIPDVTVLAKSGLSDDAIIDKIAKSGSAYSLSAEEITLLQKEGVSNRVVNYMMGTTKK